MGFIPEDAEWYLAEIVEAITVEGETSSDVHINLVLIHAKSPDEAYQKSLQRGRAREIVYTNTDHKTVTIRFAGLRDLNVIYDKLEDGAELIYQERCDMSEEDVRSLVSNQEELGVFRPIESNTC